MLSLGVSKAFSRDNKASNVLGQKFDNPMGDGSDSDEPDAGSPSARASPRASPRAVRTGEHKHERGRVAVEVRRDGATLRAIVLCGKQLRTSENNEDTLDEAWVNISLGSQSYFTSAAKCHGDTAKWGANNTPEMSFALPETVGRAACFKVELLSGPKQNREAIGACEQPLSKLLGEGGGDFTREVWFTVTSKRMLDVSVLLQNRAAQGLVGNPLLHAFLNFAFQPATKGRLAWDLVILVLVLYSSVFTPYDAAFTPDPKTYSHFVMGADGTVHFGPHYGTPFFFFRDAFEPVVDVMFFIDIVLTFFTGFDKGFEVVMDKKQIAAKYLKGWFTIDLVATVPWAEVVNIFNARWAKAQWVGMLRLMKVLRLARASRLIKRLTMSWTVHTKFTDASIFMMYVAVVCHLLACVFFLLPKFRTSCEKDQVMADDAFAKPDSSTLGWYPKNGAEGTCLQGSWRQDYGLEQRCPVAGDESADMDLGDRHGHHSEFSVYALRVCQETEEFGREPGKQTLWSERAQQIAGYNGTFTAATCKVCMDPLRLWVDSFYWSLTTMTTIGYGDRGPKTEQEIYFCLFAEIFGLAFFAILLTQINTINDVIGETAKALSAQKDGVIQFLKHHSLDPELISETVRFLNFQSTSLSGNAFSDDDPRFMMLSPGIRNKIRVHMNRPLLEKCSLFGWNPDDIAEEKLVHQFFYDIDTSGDGKLDRDEVNQLFIRLDLIVSDEEFNTCFLDLDINQDGVVSYHEFKHWWYIHQNGKPRLDRCPSDFLDLLAQRIETLAVDKGEEIVSRGNYGKYFGVVLQGIVEVCDKRVEVKGHQNDSAEDLYNVAAKLMAQNETSKHANLLLDGADFADERFVDIVKTTIDAKEDQEPVFGLMACVNDAQYAYLHNITKEWCARAARSKYVDLALISRADILYCFKERWPEGHEEMVDVAFCHYVANPDDVKAQEAHLFDVGHGSGVVVEHELENIMENEKALVEKLESSQRELGEQITQVQGEVAQINRKVDKLSTELSSLSVLLGKLVENQASQ